MNPRHVEFGVDGTFREWTTPEGSYPTSEEVADANAEAEAAAAAESAADDDAWESVSNAEKVQTAREWISSAKSLGPIPSSLGAMLDPESRDWLQSLAQNQRRIATISGHILEAFIRALRWIRRIRAAFFG